MYKARYSQYPVKKHYSVWHRTQKQERKIAKHEPLWSIVMIGVLAALILTSLFILPTLLNWIFPT